MTLFLFCQQPADSHSEGWFAAPERAIVLFLSGAKCTSLRVKYSTIENEYDKSNL